MASAIRTMASAPLLAWAVTATAQPASCDRRCLERIVERYLDALKTPIRCSARQCCVEATLEH